MDSPKSSTRSPQTGAEGFPLPKQHLEATGAWQPIGGVFDRILANAHAAMIRRQRGACKKCGGDLAGRDYCRRCGPQQGPRRYERD